MTISNIKNPVVRRTVLVVGFVPIVTYYTIKYALLGAWEILEAVPYSFGRAWEGE